MNDRIRCYCCGAESYYDSSTRIACTNCLTTLEEKQSRLRQAESRIKEWEGAVEKHRGAGNPIHHCKTDKAPYMLCNVKADEELYGHLPPK